jgi:glucosamine--fructose-6-phosphate aminotransferase (isomerizing)
MCGIVGYVGSKKNIPLMLVEGLKHLEYRGYDSAGIAVHVDGGIEILRSLGKVKYLESKIRSSWDAPKYKKASLGIAHTRWATHGLPSEINAHPHSDFKNRIALVHNGIIDNYSELKARLIAKGAKFKSETDTEVIANLIAECYEGDLFNAVATALKQVTGTYGIAVIAKDQPDKILVARKGSPIVIGIGDDEAFVASDITPLLAYTKRVIYLNDNDIVVLTASGIEMKTLDNVPVTREIAHIDWDVKTAEKGGHEHFMIKEIKEQPIALSNTLRGRLDHELSTAKLDGFGLTPRDMAGISRIVIAACGTSLHAGMVGEYYFEDLTSIPVEVEQAAEFRYRNPIINRDTLVIAISQSGETADTLAAVREAKQKGALVISICNVVGSTIARETGRGVYIHAGPEIGVASTKAFTCQVAILLMMALKFGRAGRLSRTVGQNMISDIERLPDLITKVLESSDKIQVIAKKYSSVKDFFYIGRGYLYPVALEGALKLKEISYIHAEGYHAAELKHGPIALLDENVPVLALANNIPGKDKILGNIQECRARKSPVIALVTEGDKDVIKHCDDIIEIPGSSDLIAPISTVVALQLFAYFVAKERGCSIDQPRNLAKSVTVE